MYPSLRSLKYNAKMIGLEFHSIIDAIISFFRFLHKEL